MRVFLNILCLGLLTSCSGYQWGGSKPAHLGNVRSVYIPLAKSKVIFPRVESLATNAVVDSFTVDGTYRIGSSDSADATLFLTVEELTYRQSRSSREDVLRSEELRLEVVVSYQLLDLSRPGLVLASGKGNGQTRLFVDDNLQTARASALPDALQRAANQIVARLADGM